mmetsp:Transcript_109695/g.310043  ORF Transcript_109695/g.310043 Transcript_109695/m.310043 type:complete len:333 (-) Transcript_109695:360-1358(-)
MVQEGAQSPLDLAAIDILYNAEGPVVRPEAVAGGEQGRDVVDLEAAVRHLWRLREAVPRLRVQRRGREVLPGLRAERGGRLPELRDRGRDEAVRAERGRGRGARARQEPAREVRDVEVARDQEEARAPGGLAEALGPARRGAGLLLLAQQLRDGLLAGRSVTRAAPGLAGLGVAVEGAGVGHSTARLQRCRSEVHETLEGPLAHALHAQLQEAPHKCVLAAQLRHQRLSGAKDWRGRHLRGRAPKVQNTHQRLPSSLQRCMKVLCEIVCRDERKDALLTPGNGSQLETGSVKCELGIDQALLDSLVDGILRILWHQAHACRGVDADRHRLLN